MRGLLPAVLTAVVALSLDHAATLLIPAQRDATLIEDPDGALANGAGPAVFAGRNNAADNGVRRGLFRFDLSAELQPAGLEAIELESAALILTSVTESNVAPREYRLHRVLADWGEGASSSSGGGGAKSTPGDATWVHTFWPDRTWLHNGAQFVGEPSARVVVAGPGAYRFEGAGLLRDVRLWAVEPDRNLGWILIGDETTRQTSRAFASRENPDPAVRPALEITSRPGR